jgi:hypothetical protein
MFILQFCLIQDFQQNPIYQPNSSSEEQWLSPSKLGEWDYTLGNNYTRDVFVLGNIAYLAHEELGLVFIDISDPTNPIQISAYGDDYNKTYGVYVVNETAYIADFEDGLEIVNISNPLNPVQIGQYGDSLNQTYQVIVIDDCAYVADSNDGLEIINVSDPTNPFLISRFGHNINSSRDVFVDGNTVFIADGNDGLEIINISDIQNPVLISKYGDEYNNTQGVYVVNETVYLSGWDDELEIINVSDIMNPVKIGQYEDSFVSMDVKIINQVAIIAGFSNGIYIINITDKSNPTLINNFATDGIAIGLFIDDFISYTACTQNSLEIIDLGYDQDGDGITNADELKTYNTNPNNNDTDSDLLNDYSEIFTHLTDPNNNDTDTDQLDDYKEIFTYFTDPFANDTDFDDLLDGEEVIAGIDGFITDPKNNDTDYDGLFDGEEFLIYSTNSTNNDTDYDGFLDGYEIQIGTDPNNESSYPILPNTPILNPITPYTTITTTILIDWEIVMDVDNYSVYRSLTFITEINQSVEFIANVEFSNYTDRGLIGGNFYYVIIAYNLTGQSNLSNCEEIFVETPFNLHPITPQHDYDGNIHLTWDEVPNTGNYSIARYHLPITEMNESVDWVGMAYNTSFDDIGLNEGRYYYIVFATVTGGGGKISNCVSVLVEYFLPITPVLNPIVPSVDTDGQININWSSDQNSDNYSLYRHSSFITEINQSLSIVSSFLTSTSYQDTLENGTYYYVVIARNGIGISNISNCVSVIISIPFEPNGGIPPDIPDNGNLQFILILSAIGGAIIGLGLFFFRNIKMKRKIVNQKNVVTPPQILPSTRVGKEQTLLGKFKNILDMSHEIEISRVAISLGISEAELFEKLLEWNKTIPFKIKGNSIVVEDVEEFMRALDEQFQNWKNKKK